MIHVTVSRDAGGRYRGFRCSGHAGYADPGEDIVCSAVSVLIINTVNSIEELTGDRFTLENDQQSGLVSLKFLQDPGHDASLLVDAMVIGMRSIEEQYSEFIHFDMKEV